MMRNILAIVLVVSMQAAAQTSSGPTPSSKPKVRAITGFVRLERATYQKQIADALVVLRKVKAEFESSGYGVETVRLTTQPLPELVAGMSEEQALAFLVQLDELSVKESFLPNVGPGMLRDTDDPAAMHLLERALSTLQTRKARLYSRASFMRFVGAGSVAAAEPMPTSCPVRWEFPPGVRPACPLA